jgi:tyrosinase
MVVSHAQDIANEWPEGDQKNLYLNASQTLRIPYWDWAMPEPSGQSTMPDTMGTPQITVNTPNGSQTIDNPLYTYKFHPIQSDAIGSPVTSTLSTCTSIR